MSFRCAEPCLRTRQRGVALITVLLVFALATLMAAQMLRTSHLALARTANLVDWTQARYYALGAEELARQILRDDLRVAGAARVDHLGEEWGSVSAAFEIEDGLLELAIEDESGRFNLNSLVDARGRADAAATARFARLLRALELDPLLAEATADWIDADRQTARGSPEASAYGVDAVPDRPFADSSELLTIPGIDAGAWQALAGLVTALPAGTPLNLNTASAAVLQAYAREGATAELQRFLQARKLQPLFGIAEPTVLALFPGAGSTVAVSSDFFRVLAHAQYRGRHARLATLLRRDPAKGTIEVLERSDAAKL